METKGRFERILHVLRPEYWPGAPRTNPHGHDKGRHVVHRYPTKSIPSTQGMVSVRPSPIAVDGSFAESAHEIGDIVVSGLIPDYSLQHKGNRRFVCT